jgi:hypothetical protein
MINLPLKVALTILSPRVPPPRKEVRRSSKDIFRPQKTAYVIVIQLEYSETCKNIALL